MKSIIKHHSFSDKFKFIGVSLLKPRKFNAKHFDNMGKLSRASGLEQYKQQYKCVLEMCIVSTINYNTSANSAETLTIEHQ